MICPTCGTDMHVRESRPSSHNTVRRVRECSEGHRYRSREIIEDALHKQRRAGRPPNGLASIARGGTPC